MCGSPSSDNGGTNSHAPPCKSTSNAESVMCLHILPTSPKLRSVKTSMAQTWGTNGPTQNRIQATHSAIIGAICSPTYRGPWVGFSKVVVLPWHVQLNLLDDLGACLFEARPGGINPPPASWSVINLKMRKHHVKLRNHQTIQYVSRAMRSGGLLSLGHTTVNTFEKPKQM